MKTFLDFTNKMRQELFPAGEAKTLKSAHTTYFMAAMTDLQKNIPCVQKFNVSQFPFCGTYWEDAKTVVDEPIGVIDRIYTIANGDWRDKVFYWSGNWQDIHAWARKLFRSDNPLGKSLQQGFYPANANTDTKFSRARTGIWTLHRHRLYVAPYIQSNEVLVVEWDGVKPSWSDTDGVSDWWTVDYEEAIKLYVSASHNLFYGDKQAAGLFKGEYELKRADLMIRCREMTRQQEDKRNPDQNKYLLQENLTDDAPPVVVGDAPMVMCAVGDFGQVGTPWNDVSAAIVALNPSLFVSLGDSIYEDDPANTPASIYPSLKGIKSIFAVGNHSVAYSPDLSLLTPYWPLNNGNKRYFTYVIGRTQFFILNSDPSEVDGGYVDANTPLPLSGIMMQWLAVMLSLSTADWKVVAFHHAAFTSEVDHGIGAKWMRQNYKALGADMVLDGHCHVAEHIQKDGFNYFNCGIGGKSLRAFGTATDATTLFAYNADYGFLRLTVNCSSFTVDFMQRTGTVLYSYTMTKT